MNTNVRARIDSDLKENAQKILKEHGLNLSEFIRLVLEKMIEEKQIPFDIEKRPNKVTLIAMKESQTIMERLQKKYKDVL